MDLLNDNELLNSGENSWQCKYPEYCEQFARFGWDPCDGGTCVGMVVERMRALINIMYRNISTTAWKQSGETTFTLAFDVQAVWYPESSATSPQVEIQLQYNLGNFTMYDTLREASFALDPEKPVRSVHIGNLTDMDLAGDLISLEIKLRPGYYPPGGTGTPHKFYFDNFSLKVGSGEPPVSTTIALPTTIRPNATSTSNQTASLTSLTSTLPSTTLTQNLTTSLLPVATTDANNNTYVGAPPPAVSQSNVTVIVLASALGGVAAALILFGVFFWLYRRRQKKIQSARILIPSVYPSSTASSGEQMLYQLPSDPVSTQHQHQRTPSFESIESHREQAPAESEILPAYRTDIDILSTIEESAAVRGERYH